MTEAIQKVLDKARAEIGYHESGNNLTKYASAYDFDTKLYGFDMNGQPWCDYFVDWLFMSCFGFEIGSAMTYQFAGCCGAACEASASYYRAKNAFYFTPEIGDQIFFYVNGGINHTGIVEDISNGYVTTIEGNSSDMVQRNKYRLSDPTIAGYGRPAWRYVSNIVENSSSDSVKEESNIITTPTKKVAQNTLKNGSTGHLVKALQNILNYYGATLDDDGEFGALTEAAVKQYQRTHKDNEGNELEADGIVGEKTWGSF